MTTYFLNKKSVLTISLIAISLMAFSQTNTTKSIYFDLIQVVGIYNASIDVGVLFQTDKKMDYEANIGWILPLSTIGEVGGIKTGRKRGKGIELGITPRYKFGESYLGIFSSYTYHTYNSVRLVSQQQLDVTTNYDVAQQVISNYLTFGCIQGTANFYIDMSLGIGLRVIHIKNNAEVPVSEFSETYRLGQFLEIEENGWHKLSGIKICVKVGWIFHRS